MREILNDPHIKARGVVSHFDHPAEGAFPALRNPLRFDGFDEPSVGTPPMLSADTAAVLRTELGLDAAAIDALRAERVI